MRHALFSLGDSLLSRRAEFINHHADELSKYLLSTLEASLDPASRRTVLKTIRHCLKCDAFTKALTAGLVKFEGKRPTPSVTAALLAWSSMVLQHLDIAAAKKAVAKVIECQASWMEALAVRGHRRAAGHQALGAALRAQPALLSEYLSVATAKGASGTIRKLV